MLVTKRRKLTAGMLTGEPYGGVAPAQAPPELRLPRSRIREAEDLCSYKPIDGSLVKQEKFRSREKETQ